MDNIDFSDPVQVERGFSLISNELKSLKNDATVEKENHDTLVSAIQNNPEIIRLIASDSTTNSNGLKRHIAQNYPDLHRTVSKAMNDDDDDAEDNNKEKKAKKAMSDDKKMDAETKATISIAKNSIIKELVSSFEKIHPDNGTDHTRENKILDYKASLEVKPLVALAEELDDPYRIALVAKHEEELARTTTAGSTVSTPKPQNIPFNGNPYSMTVGSASSPKKPLLARAGQTLEDMLDDNAGGMYQ